MSQINLKSIKPIAVFMMLPVLLILGRPQSADAQSSLPNQEWETHFSGELNFESTSEGQPDGETATGAER